MTESPDYQRPTAPAYYSSNIAEFLETDPAEILGHLTRHSQGPHVENAQVGAWEREIEILAAAMAGIPGFLYLEFEVPRLGSRVDAVLVIGPALFPIEFKCGATKYLRADFNQAWDYALDLKNFHRGSHHAPIFPILVATEAPSTDLVWKPPHADGVHEPRQSNADGLRGAIDAALMLASGKQIDGQHWGLEPYHPTPTIIQAAQALYARHSVQAISRNDAGAKNLTVTSRTVEDVIERARTKQEKAIVFVTGVPGAGKTLVGLNVATRHRRAKDQDPAHAVFLSGNAPLVKVLCEALVRDEVSRLRSSGVKARKGAVGQNVKAFIQNVHHFRDAGLNDMRAAPHDHVVIFDEAQRAWNQKKTAEFMRIKKKRPGFDMSEPEFLISYMDRRDDWAVVICLVGGGQEINSGEAGISTWLEAVRMRFPNWRVHISKHLTDSEYAAGKALEVLGQHTRIETSPDLHLSVSMRSFRAEHVSAFVKALLDSEIDKAQAEFAKLAGKYPMVITRDLARAREWVRRQARGSERYGLVASSKGERLKPHAVDVRFKVDPVHWFLHDESDTRSSNYMEDAATEFQVQGLELDWACVTWDGDLRRSNDAWHYHRFRGDRWVDIRRAERQQYLVNAYRVLLTRARQGMVVFVPTGDSHDPTRAPKYYDSTYDYLRRAGLSEI
ncbi:MAG: DUF2075 domain-containing protein [Planctomycetes bacterium]|nr:DUF2075 domain-containing protein [Planctomycetota bacterium]